MNRHFSCIRCGENQAGELEMIRLQALSHL